LIMFTQTELDDHLKKVIYLVVQQLTLKFWNAVAKMIILF
jgi:hypothetical protein